MKKRLSDLFDGEDINNIESGIVFKKVSENIDKLDKNEFVKALSALPWQAQIKLMKKRCDVAKDRMACEAYELALNGDPSAPAGTPKNLGLKGLALYEDNMFAKELLKELGEL